MSAVTKFLAGGVVAAALVSAAPAAAQYYPGYGYGGVGQVINQVFGGGYGNPGYVNQQAVVNQCAAAVQQRLSGGYGYSPYSYNNYGYGARGRVLGISRVEPRSDGGLTVRGVASSGRYAGYTAQAPVDLTWRCRTDYRGLIRSVDVNPAQRNYGYGNTYGYGDNNRYSPYANDYSQYGYSRY